MYRFATLAHIVRHLCAFSITRSGDTDLGRPLHPPAEDAGLLHLGQDGIQHGLHGVGALAAAGGEDGGEGGGNPVHDGLRHIVAKKDLPLLVVSC